MSTIDIAAAHREWREAGFTTMPVKLVPITDSKGERKKKPKFPGSSWEAAKAYELLKAIREGFSDLALELLLAVQFDFDPRDNETKADVRTRMVKAVVKWNLDGIQVETGRGYQIILRAPAGEWARNTSPPDLIDEVRCGTENGHGLLCFSWPSWHPVSECRYTLLSPIRPLAELGECPVELLTPLTTDEPARARDNGRAGLSAEVATHRSNFVVREPAGRGGGAWTTLDIVGLFQAHGLYLRDLSGGKHGVTCPWSAMHTTGGDGTDTAIFEAHTTKTGFPGFQCQHKHCERRGLADVREFFGVGEVDRYCSQPFRPAPLQNGALAREAGGNAATAAALDAPPIIQIRQELNPVTDESLSALAGRAELGIYVRGRMLVTVGRDGSARERWLRRPPGSPVIVPIAPARMLALLDDAARWQKYIARDKTWVPARSPEWVAAQVLARLEWPFPYLDAVVETPTIRPDGSILDVPGWDEATGLLYEPAPGIAWGSVPDRPTEKDVAKAVAALVDPVRDFPFVALSDQAAYVAAVLTLIARHLIDGPTPAFPVRAPTPGTGKGLLAQVMGLIGTGRVPPVMTMAYDGDELRKRITALAVSGAPVCLLDNLSGSVGSDAWAAALTSTEWEDRVLGSTQMVRVPLRVVWLATGNNVGFRRTLGRRVVPIDLDAKLEQPEDRNEFRYPELIAHVRKNRPQLVSAALTLLRGFFFAGRPQHGRARMGSFEAWDDLVRSGVIWAGLDDPASTEDPTSARGRIRGQADDDTDTLAALLEALDRAYPLGTGFTAAELIRRAHADDALREALDVVAAPKKGGRATSSSIGARLREVRDRPLGGRAVRYSRPYWNVENTG